MRYGKVYAHIWNDAWFVASTRETQRVFLYLLSSPHGNIAGIYVLKSGYAQSDLRITAVEYQRAMAELLQAKSDDGLSPIEYDEKTETLLIRNHLKYSPLDGPKQSAAVVSVLKSLPKSRLVDAFLDRLKILCPKCFDTVSVLYLNTNGSVPIPGAVTGAVTGSKRKDILGDLRHPACEVLKFLNEKANRKFQGSDYNIRFITARLKEGATVTQCRQVIVRKVREWGSDEKMSKFLRPETLFGPKFNSYVGELVAK